MSEHSGVPGKTPWQAARAKRAAERLAVREGRTVDEQIALLSTRPGESKREQARLAMQLVISEAQQQADRGEFTPQPRHTRRKKVADEVS